ncbi:hypothetical protein SZ25_00382 [Candidatus Arcanobacter lacustris]|uniref:Uncharacterized protein n=1 Tax=Candidatus Arcanibacter lacustris TaxID=1607817 RepID=A0A0F5MP14_9RICK|nr:hypothetical protein SZ25_00382 [Candidatus Arcanobacter lacustris]
MICEQYNSRILYYNMMKEYIENKITALNFKNEYLDHQSEDAEYSNPYFNVFKIKLSNKDLFDKKNSDLLHEVEDTINAMEFSNKYCKQRHKDMNEAEKNGYTHDVYEEKMKALKNHEKEFQEKYSDVLYEEGISAINNYEQGAKELNIKGELFFMGIMNFIDIHAMEFTPRDSEGFNPKFDIDEKGLRIRIKNAFDVLERNKDRWT